MKRKGDSWVLPYVLGAGNHEYKFIVDGQWITDPKNALTKTSSGITNSLLILHPNHTFVLNGNSNAKKVIVTGTFNDWDKEGFLMKKVNNQWVFQLHLPQGKTLYKFIVDGNWIIDPENGDW
jgi:type 1 glutamine amidotransferase